MHLEVHEGFVYCLLKLAIREGVFASCRMQFRLLCPRNASAETRPLHLRERAATLAHCGEVGLNDRLIIGGNEGLDMSAESGRNCGGALDAPRGSGVSRET